MRKRYQEGSLKAVNGKWIAQWRDESRQKRKKVLGRVGPMTKSQAKTALAEIVAPLNARDAIRTTDWKFADFVMQVFLPFFERKWKRSTLMTNRDRIEHHLLPALGSHRLAIIDRNALQDILDRKAVQGLSFSTVDHLRWDLHHIFEMAVSEGCMSRNPAAVLFTPRQCPRPRTAIMNAEEVTKLFSILDTRELLIAKLATIAGLRPGEIFALRWGRLQQYHFEIRERVYRGDLDTPKTWLSVRRAALADGLRQSIQEWHSMSVDTGPEAWVFPSETLVTPLSKDNCWRRHFKPRLEAAGLGWVNFQVMRKTHNSTGVNEEIDRKILAEQMGHSVDVNQNVYTESSMQRRLAAVNKIEKALHLSTPIEEAVM